MQTHGEKILRRQEAASPEGQASAPSLGAEFNGVEMLRAGERAKAKTTWSVDFHTGQWEPNGPPGAGEADGREDGRCCEEWGSGEGCMETGEVLHAEWKSQGKGEEMPLDALASADAAPTRASRLLLWATGLAA